MKKLFIYGTMALMALTSCNDFLDKAPLDAFTNTPAYWSNTIHSITTIRVMEMAAVADGFISKH